MRRFLSSLMVIAPMLLAACGDKPAASVQGNPEKGRTALTQYACQACHMIPGITGSEVFVGPPLDSIASRPMIAGRLTNTPDNLIAWIRNPQAIAPQTAMPDMGVSEPHARDMAAYLATLK